MLYSKATQLMEGSQKMSRKSFLRRYIWAWHWKESNTSPREYKDVGYQIERGKVGGKAWL